MLYYNWLSVATSFITPCSVPLMVTCSANGRRQYWIRLGYSCLLWLAPAVEVWGESLSQHLPAKNLVIRKARDCSWDLHAWCALLLTSSPFDTEAPIGVKRHRSKTGWWFFSLLSCQPKSAHLNNHLINVMCCVSLSHIGTWTLEAVCEGESQWYDYEMLP